MKEKIRAMDKAQNFISYVYKDTLRAMIHLMGDFYYIDSENKTIRVKSMHANQERAIAKIRQTANIILPIITVSQTTSDNNEDRQKYSSNLIHETQWDDEKQRAVRILSFNSRPIDILYKVNIWSKYREDMDHILEQLRLMFNPSIEIETPLSNLAKGILMKENDISEIETGDGSDRLVRKEIEIKVETYIPSPRYKITSTGEIDSMNAEVDLFKN